MKKMTCARIAACKTSSSERHNQRLKDLDYVRRDLSKNNRQEVTESISHRLEIIRQIYEKVVGQKMQKTAEPILECVLVVDQNTTLAQVKEFGRLCQKEFGLTPFQWYLHMDEGHYDRDSGEWIPNYHAHIVFDATHQDHRLVERTVKSNGKNLKGADGKPLKQLVDGYGKTIKLDRSQMRRMQDLAALATGLERGTPSGKNGLSSIDFKIDQRKKDLGEISRVVEKVGKISALQNLIAGVAIWRAKKDASEHIVQQIKLAETRVKGLSTMIENLECKRDGLLIEISRLENAAALHAATSDNLENKILTLRQELAEIDLKIDEKRGKLNVAERELSDIKNRCDFYEKRSVEVKVKATEIVMQKRAELSQLSELDQARVIGWQHVAHVVSDIISMMYDNGVQLHQDHTLRVIADNADKSPEEIRNEFDVFGALMAENYDLVATLVGGGGAAAAGAGGGGVQSDIPWRDPKEDDDQWRHRAAQYAFNTTSTARRRKK